MCDIVLFIVLCVLFLLFSVAGIKEIIRIFRRRECESSQLPVYKPRTRYVTEYPPLTGKSIIADDPDYTLYLEEDDSLECIDSMEDVENPPEKICLDDEDILEEESEESKAAYEYLKAVQEQMEAVQPSYKEDYQGDEFALMMAQPIESSHKALLQISNIPAEDISPTDKELEDWIYYSRVDFALDSSFKHLQICLHINRRTYKKDMEAKDVRECLTISDDGIISSYLSSWWYRSQLAAKYFRDEIIREYDMVKDIGIFSGRTDVLGAWNVDVRDIKVSDLWFDVSDCCIRRTGYDEYRIFATIDNETLNAKLSDEDINLYLEKDMFGNYLKQITPQKLMVKYFFHYITKRNPKNDDFVCIVDSFTPCPGPVFRMDDKFYMTEEAKSDIFGGTSKIICVKSEQERTYYLDTYICGIHRSVCLERKVVLDLLELNEKLEFTHKKSPDDIAGYYFGHELTYLQNGYIPERIEELVHTKHSYYKPGSDIFPDIFDYEDYPDTDCFSILKIDSSKVGIIWDNYRSKEAHHCFTLRINIGGWIYEFDVTYHDICNYLERDENGKYTRRVSLEQLSSKYIKKYVGMVKMYEAGVPIAIIARFMEHKLSEVKKITDSLGIAKVVNHADKINKTIRKNIIEDFFSKADLTELKEKYGLTEYATLYKILGYRATGKKSVYPSEFAEYVNAIEPSKYE